MYVLLKLTNANNQIFHLQCSDPQRIVFNEDVCHYIYPLKSRENSFYLILLILRLLKVPILQSDVLAGRFCARVQHIGDSDAIEDALACCLIGTNDPNDPQRREFIYSLYELAKEMAVSPTYISSNIGHEIYIKCITQLILNCADAYVGIDEQKRIVLLLLWCRFERMLLVLQKCAKKLTIEYVKGGRNRFKAMLKQKLNRNVVNFYTEFALYEYESLSDEKSDLQAVQNIFNNIIVPSTNTDDSSSADRCFACVTYAEILIANGKNEEAERILLGYILNIDLNSNTDTIGGSKKLTALQTITKKLDNIILIEQNVDIMILEQHFLPDLTVSLLKMKILLQYLLGQQLEAVAYLEKLLSTFIKSTERSRFICEQIFQIYVSFLQQRHQQFCISNSLLSTKVTEALRRFPRNLYFLQCCGIINSIPWYKLRSTMLRENSSVMSIVFLIATARHRFMTRITTKSEPMSSCDSKHNQNLVRNRILNMFKLLTTDDRHADNSLHRNPLFWRLYLCCLSDKNTAFETSKRCLLQALDECPWSKALYIDGATHVPQELSHLQDLLIEKHMRVYALPEELEILRER